MISMSKLSSKDCPKLHQCQINSIYEPSESYWSCLCAISPTILAPRYYTRPNRFHFELYGTTGGECHPMISQGASLVPRFLAASEWPLLCLQRFFFWAVLDIPTSSLGNVLALPLGYGKCRCCDLLANNGFQQRFGHVTLPDPAFSVEVRILPRRTKCGFLIVHQRYTVRAPQTSWTVRLHKRMVKAWMRRHLRVDL